MLGSDSDDSAAVRLAAALGRALLCLVACCWSPTAWGAPTTVGVFVGSNRPGEGQQELQFAVRDAERMRAVLAEIGGLSPADAVFLTDPDADQVLEAIAAQSARVRELQDAGQQTLFVFYYSGHARSDALTLGASELDLTELRPRLEEVDSTVTLAVLDACQAGAFSGIKGVAPGGEFSFDATQMLRSEGLAVMASSTATELSQESVELGGSFFTHHLVTGLRGPADRDQDGSVSLDEAYAYAYHHTLVTTAPTRVGGQHVTLETQLRGKGEMVLTRPAAADAWLVLDGAAGERLLVIHQGSGTVAAEVVKEPESSFSLALPSGRYRVISRGASPRSCRVVLVASRSTALSQADCVPLRDDVAMTVKAMQPYRSEPLVVELGLGAMRPARSGAFFSRIGSFGFQSQGLRFSGVASLAVAGRLGRRGAVVATMSTLDAGSYSRQEQGPRSEGEVFAEHRFRWSAQRVSGSLRYTVPLVGNGVLLGVQAGGGPTLVSTSYAGSTGSTTNLQLGLHASASTALYGLIRTRGLDFGPFLGIGFVYSPALRNLLEERGDVGGLSVITGLRMSP